MRRLRRGLLFTTLVVVVALSALVPLSVATVRQSFPQVSGHLDLPGLSAKVEVLRDSYGVPQIYADNPEDLFEAQGFVQAQDRFYEMDFRRHLAAGRLSELYGKSQVETDTYIRTLGWRRVAERELPLLSSSTRRYLDAYAAGVNAYIRDRSPAQLSLEYSLLGVQGLHYTPEDWTAADSVAWLKVMAWDLGSNIDLESERAVVTGAVGAQQAASLYPAYPLSGYDPIVTRGSLLGRAFSPDAGRGSARVTTSSLTARQLRAATPALTAAANVQAALPDVLASDGLGAENGSNSWVVAGSRTASGHPLLANDPHLATSMPSIFAQVGLHCRQVSAGCPFDVTGFSLASVPGVVIGKNASIAWGMTTSYLDVEDLYLEQVQGDTVREGDAYVPLTVTTEELKVRGEDQPRTIRIRSSRHGPLLSDASSSLQEVGRQRGAGAPYAVSLAWTGSRPGRTMDALFGIDTAKNFTEFRAAAAKLTAPSQNLVYADTAGNIGYQLPGLAPVRGRGNGELPSPGWDTAYDWKGMIPFAELPYAYNPPSGYIVAANQPVIGRQYPYVLGSEYSYGWRSQEIDDRLKEAPALDLDQAESIFYDTTIRPAGDIVPALLKVKVADPWVAEGQQTLVGWDYDSDPDSAAAAYFAVVFHDILKLTFRDQLPAAQWPTTSDRWYAVVAQLLKEPKSPWWDDVSTSGKVETRDDILLAAMTDARKEITSLMARDTSGWQWGKLHTVTLRNQTLGESGIRPVEALFNRAHGAVGGGPAVVDAMAFDDTLSYVVTHGPTMRMLVDLGDLDHSRWVNQSGVSGHAFSPHYDDQTALWAGNKMWPYVSSRAAVDGRTAQKLTLTPGG